MERYNPLAAGHVRDGAPPGCGFSVWILTDVGRPFLSEIGRYFQDAGYEWGTWWCLPRHRSGLYVEGWKARP